VLKYTIDI